MKQIENNCEDKLEYAIEIYAYVTKKQIFWDGNKRTALLMANKILIENGMGILNIDAEKTELFSELLSNHYINPDKKNELKYFLKSNFIETIIFENQHQNIKIEKIKKDKNRDMEM